MRKQTESLLEQKAYRSSLSLPDSLKAAAYGTLSVLSCGVLLWLLFSPQLGLPQKLMLAFIWAYIILLSAGMCLWKITLAVVTSPEGITYSRQGLRIFTSWSNIECISTRTEKRFGRTFTSSGLKLYQPAPIYKPSLLARWILIQVSGNPCYFIPLSELVKDWQYSEIAEDIRRYRPEALQFFQSYHEP